MKGFGVTITYVMGLNEVLFGAGGPFPTHNPLLVI